MGQTCGNCCTADGDKNEITAFTPNSQYQRFSSRQGYTLPGN